MSERNVFDQVEMGVRLPSGAFTRNIFTTVENITKMRKKYKNRGVYVSAYRYEDAKDKSNESLLYGNLYIDLDMNDLTDEDLADEAFEKIREDGIKVVSFLSAIFGIDEDMIRIYFSGQKGLHIIVSAKILGIKPMRELNHIFKIIALEVHKMSKHKTIDTGIYDNARLFSLPNVKHPETGKFKIPLTYSELRSLSFDKIKRLASKKRKVKYKRPRYNTKAHRIFQSYIQDWEKVKKIKQTKDKHNYKRKLDFLPPCIESILNRECPSGFRNNTAAALSSYFKQRGYSKDKGWKELQKWNEEYARLPLKELETTFESIYNGDYVYGCSTLEQLGICQMDKCKIGKNRMRKEKEALGKSKR